MKRVLCFLVLISLILCVFTGCDLLTEIQSLWNPDDTGADTSAPSVDTPSTDEEPPVGETPPAEDVPPADEVPPTVDVELPNDFGDEEDLPTTDPYTNVNKNAFYANYTPAKNYKDAEYRTKHFLMSGSIASQDQRPTIAGVQPKNGTQLLRNSAMYYADGGNTYFVLDANGDVANKIYKGGAYVTLEEVAAYVFAFGTVPANYVSGKNVKPTSSDWGKYLRLNHSKFSGDTSDYPYEPELPNISGCGGSYQYYEIDIGTTGTDCDPQYYATVYNNGSNITRGAARIVYARYEYGKQLTGTYVFYTYNHYNDFQEYLNYEGGWGKMFGNITGGGSLSSKNPSYCNPTPYVETQRSDFTLFREQVASLTWAMLTPTIKEYLEVTYAT